MDCIECKKKIRAFSDKKLKKQETLDFINHVYSCERCFDEAKNMWFYYRVDDLLQKQVETPGYRLRYAFEEELEERESGVHRTFILYALLFLSLILAALVAIFLLI